MNSNLIKCRWQKLKCCMRNDEGRCIALDNADFDDGQCHFRKRKSEGINLYEVWKEKQNVK